MRPSPSPAAARGFTLLEIIIVVLVFSVMAAMAYGGLNSVLRTRVAIEESLTRTAAMQRAYFRLRNDFQNLRNRPIRDGFGDVQPALATDRDGVVTLTRGGWRNPLLLPRGSFERVSYRLDDRKLIRSSWRVLDQAQDSKPVELTVLDQVLESRWRFLGADNDWSESWPSGALGTEERSEARPPRAVELTLITADWGELKIIFEAGAASAGTDFASEAAGGGDLDGATPVPDSQPEGEEPPPPDPDEQVQDPPDGTGDGEAT